ncbi:MAG: helix-turn-helix domain-containing protein [Alphaproteobacteria bacterium]|nr:helix-turn-helix domain-containing protein [Alphaproteobacteria bacterium]
MPPAPDIPGIVRAIEATGLSRRQIAKRIGVAPATVCAWVTELRTPTYRHGAALVELAREHQSAPPDVTPRVTCPDVGTIPAAPAGRGK